MNNSDALPDDVPALLTVAEAAELCRVTERSIYRHIAAGTLPSRKLAAGRGTRTLIAKADIERLLRGADA